MSLPGGFSDCKGFWGIQLEPSAREKQIRVNSDTKLHISNVIVDSGHASHKANCSVSIGVRYETVRCDCDVTTQSCSLHTEQQQSCLICVIKPEKKSEAELDLNFVGGKNLIFFYSNACACDFNSRYYAFSVNISGYEVRG